MAKSAKMMKAKQPSDSKARGMKNLNDSNESVKAKTKNNVKGLMKAGKGK
jgi:hypothetical protein